LANILEVAIIIICIEWKGIFQVDIAIIAHKKASNFVQTISTILTSLVGLFGHFILVTVFVVLWLYLGWIIYLEYML